MNTLSITLYGPPHAVQRARGMLENLPQVRRVDGGADASSLCLLLSDALHENSLIELLAPSGVSGFRLIRM